MKFSNRYPITPAESDAIRVSSFVLLIIKLSENAKSAMKMDMVNPIPPKNPTLIICFHFMSEGNLVNPRSVEM